MVIVTIEDTAGWRIDSYGNGWAYQIERKHDGATGWLQDDDATRWRADYDDMRYWSHARNASYDSQLAELCDDYVAVEPL